MIVIHQLNESESQRILMSDSFPLPTKPEDNIPSLVRRFNSGQVSNQMAMYAPEAVFIANDGRTITDHAEIAATIERDIKLGLPLVTNVRHVFVADDTAQIVVDWSIDGKGPDGKDVHLGGSACDIARRGEDGFRRYIKGLLCDSPPDMCATAALSDGATPQPGVDEHHFVKLPSRRFWTCTPEFSGRRRGTVRCKTWLQ